jgi:hypothetical protein
VRKSCQIASIAFHNIVRLKFWLPCLAVMDWNLFSESLFEKWEKYSRGYNWYHIIWIRSNKWRKEMVDSNILTMIKQARFWKISLIFYIFTIYCFLLIFSECWKCSYRSVQDSLQRSWLEGHCWFNKRDFYNGICGRRAQWEQIPQACQEVFKSESTLFFQKISYPRLWFT